MYLNCAVYDACMSFATNTRNSQWSIVHKSLCRLHLIHCLMIYVIVIQCIHFYKNSNVTGKIFTSYFLNFVRHAQDDVCFSIYIDYNQEFYSIYVFIQIHYKYRLRIICEMIYIKYVYKWQHIALFFVI